MADYETCDGCGKNGGLYPLYEGDELRGYVVPDGETLCGECARERNVHTADEMSDVELIAAIVDDSLGYATPDHAARHVADFRAGREGVESEGRRYGCWCERGSAVFENDLDALIESARRHHLFMSEEKRARVAATVEKWSEMDEIGAMGLSLAYPTL